MALVLNSSRGQRICYIKGGEFDGSVVRLISDSGDKIKNKDMIQALQKTVKKTKDKIKKADNEKEEQLMLDDMSDELTEEVGKNLGKSFSITDGQLLLVPDDQIDLDTKEERTTTIFMAAPRGSGKSTFAANFVDIYKKLYKKNKFFIFSRVDKDDKLDKLDPIRINLDDEDIVNNPINIKELANSVILFDDLDTKGKGKIAKKIRELRDVVYENGRHNNITVLTCAHTLLNHQETKSLISESEFVVMFVKAGLRNQYMRFLETYVGINKKDDKELLNKIFKCEGRYIIVKKSFPIMFMDSKNIWLL